MRVEAVGLCQALLPFSGAGSAGAATWLHGDQNITDYVVADRSLMLYHDMLTQVNFVSFGGNIPRERGLISKCLLCSSSRH